MHTYWMDMYCMDTYWRDTCCTDTYWHDTYWIDTYWRDAYWRDTCWMDTYWHDTCWRDTYWRDTDWNDMCGSVEWCILILIDMHGMIYCPQSSEEPCDETSFGKKITSFEKMHAMKTHGGQEQFKSFNTSLIAWIWISHTVFCSLLWAVPMKHELSCSSLVSWEKTQLAQECRGAQVKNSSYTCPWSKSNKNCSCQVSQGKTEHSKAQHIEALAAKTRLLSSVLDLLGHHLAKEYPCWSYVHQWVPELYNSRNFEPWFSHDRSVDFQDYFCLVQGRQELGFDRHASNVRKDTLSKPTGDSVYRVEMRYSQSQRSSIAQRKDRINLTRLKVLKSLEGFWKLRSHLLKLSAASLRQGYRATWSQLIK